MLEKLMTDQSQKVERNRAVMLVYCAGNVSVLAARIHIKILGAQACVSACVSDRLGPGQVISGINRVLEWTTLRTVTVMSEQKSELARDLARELAIKTATVGQHSNRLPNTKSHLVLKEGQSGDYRPLRHCPHPMGSQQHDGAPRPVSPPTSRPN